jgi:hypothetical protein
MHTHAHALASSPSQSPPNPELIKFLFYFFRTITSVINRGHFFLQTSGSLYGALIGSVLAFNIADFLGELFFISK